MNQPTTHCDYCTTALCKGCRDSISPRGTSQFERVITSSPYLSENKMTGKIIRNVAN